MDGQQAVSYAPVSAPSRVIQAVSGQPTFTVVQQAPVCLGQHQLPVRPVTQNGKHAIPVTSISSSIYGTNTPSQSSFCLSAVGQFSFQYTQMSKVSC